MICTWLCCSYECVTDPQTLTFFYQLTSHIVCWQFIANTYHESKLLQIPCQTDWLTDRLTTSCSSPQIQELRDYRHFSVANSLWRYNICIFQFAQANIHKIDFVAFNFCFITASINLTCKDNLNWCCSLPLRVYWFIFWWNLISFKKYNQTDNNYYERYENDFSNSWFRMNRWCLWCMNLELE